MNITQFTMEDVRCFSERQTLEIRPLDIFGRRKQHRQNHGIGVFSCVSKLSAG